MEPSRKLGFKFESLKTALNGFDKFLKLTADSLDPILADAVRNGAIQKFEYCSELCWKAMKSFLAEVHGVDAGTPKQVFKECFLTGLLQEAELDLALEMVDDRNWASRMCREKDFLVILDRLPRYLQLMMVVVQNAEKVLGAR